MPVWCRPLFKMFDLPSFIRRLSSNFGRQFVLMMFSVYFIVKGFLLQLLSLTQLPYYQSLGVSGVRYQVYQQVAFTPWAMKAWIGSLSDLRPFFGYHKRWYMFFGSILGSSSVLFLALVHLNHQTAPAAAVLMFFCMIQIAIVDLLCEGKYAELMRQMPQTKADLVSWVWGCVMMGSLIGSCLVGPLADNVNPKYLYFIALPAALQVIYPIVSGYLPERYLAPEQCVFQKQKFTEQKNLFFLAFLMALSALVLAIVSLSVSETVVLVYVISVSAVLSFLGFLWLPRLLAMCNLYMFLQEALYIQIGGALDYWYTASHECVPGGPSFDYTYYSTVTQIVGSIAGGLGVVMFQVFMSDWKFRHCFWICTLIRIAASFFDILITSRTNITLGIPDKVTYMFGDAFIYQTASMLFFLPSIVLTSKICPRGYESTIYALLAGFQNFGQQVSRSIGIYLISAFGIRTETPCSFDGLTWLILISHAFLPFITLPLTFILLPDARLSDDLAPDTDLKPSSVAYGVADGTDQPGSFGEIDTTDQELEMSDGVVSDEDGGALAERISNGDQTRAPIN